MADTDRELLELAAKAIGEQVKKFSSHATPAAILAGRGLWDPLENDGTALRLAVQLRLDIHVDGNLTEVHGPFDGFFTEAHLGDPCAATRRAIVRTAAEIGRAM